jgi:hypothetical protein
MANSMTAGFGVNTDTSGLPKTHRLKARHVCERRDYRARGIGVREN